MDRAKLFLFIGILYSFIPFEASSSRVTLAIRLVILTIFTIYIYSTKEINTNLYKTMILLLILIFAYFSALKSISLYLFIFLTSIISGYIISSAIQNNKELYKNFITVWEWLIVFSIAMLFLQQIAFFLTGNILKLHELIFPISKARTEVIEQLHLIRFGGIYIEPGTYANFMYLFLTIYMVIKKNFNTLLVTIGAISIISTMSVWGMIFGTYLLIISTLLKIKKVSLVKKMLGLFILISSSIYGANAITNSSAYEYAKMKLEMKSDSGHSKVVVVNRFKENIKDYAIIGDGFDPKIVMNVTAPQDAGFILNLSIVLGILFSFIVVAIYSLNIINQIGLLTLISSFPILISKIFYWEFAFWLLFFISFRGNLELKN